MLDESEVSLTLTSSSNRVYLLFASPRQDANVIGGDFRLGFSGYTTSSISYDATASELGVALSNLPSIDSVDVSSKLWWLLPWFSPARGQTYDHAS